MATNKKLNILSQTFLINFGAMFFFFFNKKEFPQLDVFSRLKIVRHSISLIPLVADILTEAFLWQFSAYFKQKFSDGPLIALSMSELFRIDATWLKAGRNTTHTHKKIPVIIFFLQNKKNIFPLKVRLLRPKSRHSKKKR